jgi:hypothetical protein
MSEMQSEVDEPSEEDLVSAKKLEKLDKEKGDLLASLSGGDFSKQRTRVAYILNLFPESRNSDITLTLKYWETFQPDIYNEHAIAPKDLFRLERLHYIVRARAKIQNEYKLFTSDEGVRRHRRKREEEMHDGVVKDIAPRKIVNVYADETGKNQDYLIVASVWVLTGRAVFTVGKAISDWKDTSLWAKREIHFAKFGKRDEEPLKEFLSVIQENREFLSFKAIAVESKQTKRSTEEVVEKLHEHMLINGVDHELESNRISKQHEIEVTLDEEQSLDAITLTEMKRRVNSDLKNTHGAGVSIASIESISSRGSVLVQLSDLVAGAINRRLNHKGNRNFKDDMADRIIHALDLQLDESEIDSLDVSAMFKV